MIDQLVKALNINRSMPSGYKKVWGEKNRFCDHCTHPFTLEIQLDHTCSWRKSDIKKLTPSEHN